MISILRGNVCKFILCFSSHFIFRQKASFGGLTAVVKPFHISVWLAVIFLLAATAIMFTVSSKLVIKESEQVIDLTRYYTREEKYNYSSGAMVVVGIISQQGIQL